MIKHYIQVRVDVRYWEDASVNGVDDIDGSLIPCRLPNGRWAPRIDILTGQIQNWPQGTTADVHYKVCDAGKYFFEKEEIEGNETNITVQRYLDDYVPHWLAPGAEGYGDYIILKIDENGFIKDWSFNFVPEDWK